MPANKNLLARVRVIDGCLRSKTQKFWSKVELIGKIEEKTDIKIKDRTIIQDLYLMRFSDQLNFYAPIKHSKKDNGYYYTDPNYSIEKLPLNSQDIQALSFVAATLMQYKNNELFSEFSSSMQKVVNLVSHIQASENKNISAFIDFEKAPYTKGYEHLENASKAIRAKTTLSVFYQKFDDAEPSLRIISPYLLKEYRNRWYLVGLQHDKSEVRTFALDRIVGLELNEEVNYDSQFSIDPDTYFKNTIGISLTEGAVEEVILSFKPTSGKYIKTQHLHSTQEILVDNEQELRVKLNVVSNYELQSIILSFGKEVRVISPETLRDKIFHQLTESICNYETCKPNKLKLLSNINEY